MTVFTEAKKVPTRGILELKGKGARVTWNVGNRVGTKSKVKHSI